VPTLGEKLQEIREDRPKNQGKTKNADDVRGHNIVLQAAILSGRYVTTSTMLLQGKTKQKGILKNNEIVKSRRAALLHYQYIAEGEDIKTVA